MREDRAFSDTLSQRQRLALDLRRDAIEEAPGLAFLGAHGTSGVKQFCRAPLTDHPRQQSAGTHVAAGQADPREKEGRLGRRCGKPQVRRQGDHGPRTDANSLDGRNDRTPAADDRLDQIAGHARKGQQALHIHLDQRADDLVHVAAGTEVPAVGGEDHGVHILGINEIAEGIAQLRVTLERQRILTLGPHEAQDGNATLHTPLEVLRLEVRQLHVSTFRIFSNAAVVSATSRSSSGSMNC